ncbi:MAG: tRNA (adenosine(37)-N6)-threonylcarbamoyltransferase complex dimerization subunit type 1 TsaB [Candidatus Sumerlaeaceae bacterium]
MILGIESSGNTGGVALLDKNGLRGTAMVTSRMLYSQRLLPSIEWLLQRSGAHMSDVTGIAVSLGPGSFTGLRVGLSTAKGLAFAQKLPIVGVSTLEALALRAAVPWLACRVCTVLDARHDLLYAALYVVANQALAESSPELGSAAAVQVLQPPQVSTPAMVAEWISEPTVFAGDAALERRSMWQSLLGPNFLLPPIHRVLPSAEEVAFLGAQRLVRGESDSLPALEPFYLRRSYTENRKTP